MAWIVYGVVIMLMYENVKYLCRTVDHISYCHSLLIVRAGGGIW